MSTRDSSRSEYSSSTILYKLVSSDLTIYGHTYMFSYHFHIGKQVFPFCPLADEGVPKWSYHMKEKLILRKINVNRMLQYMRS